MLKKLTKISIAFLFLIFIHTNVKATETTDIKRVIPIKDWQIKFNQEVSFDSAKENIKVKDIKGQDVNITLDLGQDKKTIIVKAPNNGYENGQSYSLHINSNIKSKDGKYLNKSIDFKFNIEGYQPTDYLTNNIDDVTMKKADEIIASVIKPGMTDFEKELALYDYVMTHAEYDNVNYRKNTIPDESHTAYGILVKGIGVCDGYSKAMALLLNKVGIECTIIVSYEMDHAWNIVRIDGKLYHLDATFGDGMSSAGGTRMYDYFNLTDDQISISHEWDRTRYPICNEIKYTYENYKYCKDNNISLDNRSRIISGTLTLPNGEVADEDITVKVTAATNHTSYYKVGTELVISKGFNSVEYSLIVPDFSSGYILGYELPGGHNKKYKSQAYYREDTSTHGGITYPPGYEPKVVYYKNGAMSTYSPNGTRQNISKGNKIVNMMLVPYEQNDFEDFIIN